MSYYCTKLLSTTNSINFSVRVMSKHNKSKKTSQKIEATSQDSSSNSDPTFPISVDKSNFVIINIHAKPGAKQNAIMGISPEGIEVQINAPPTEGAANTELVKYIASVVGVSKGNVSFERGHKSRSKTLKITDSVSFDTVKKKIMDEIENK